jgi:AcrR family transcriptional regulator
MITVSTSDRAYHHGDLRSALVAAALASVGEVDALSLRAVARQVGVSATAVYRHFPDKQALLAAVASAGLEQLGAAQRAAFEAAGGGLAGFNATGVAYVRFAFDNPALFRLIFAQPAGEAMREAADVSDDAMTFLLANAAALAPEGVDARVFALQAWSIAHGLAMLILDGLVPVDWAIVRQVIDAHAMAGQ